MIMDIKLSSWCNSAKDNNVVGVAPDVELYPVKVINTVKEITDGLGVDWCIENKMQIIA